MTRSRKILTALLLITVLLLTAGALAACGKKTGKPGGHLKFVPPTPAVSDSEQAAQNEPGEVRQILTAADAQNIIFDTIVHSRPEGGDKKTLDFSLSPYFMSEENGVEKKYAVRMEGSIDFEDASRSVYLFEVTGANSALPDEAQEKLADKGNVILGIYGINGDMYIDWRNYENGGLVESYVVKDMDLNYVMKYLDNILNRLDLGGFIERFKLSDVVNLNSPLLDAIKGIVNLKGTLIELLLSLIDNGGYIVNKGDGTAQLVLPCKLTSVLGLLGGDSLIDMLLGLLGEGTAETVGGIVNALLDKYISGTTEFTVRVDLKNDAFEKAALTTKIATKGSTMSTFEIGVGEMSFSKDKAFSSGLREKISGLDFKPGDRKRYSFTTLSADVALKLNLEKHTYTLGQIDSVLGKALSEKIAPEGWKEAEEREIRIDKGMEIDLHVRVRLEVDLQNNENTMIAVEIRGTDEKLRLGLYYKGDENAIFADMSGMGGGRVKVTSYSAYIRDPDGKYVIDTSGGKKNHYREWRPSDGDAMRYEFAEGLPLNLNVILTHILDMYIPEIPSILDLVNKKDDAKAAGSESDEYSRNVEKAAELLHSGKVVVNRFLGADPETAAVDESDSSGSVDIMGLIMGIVGSAEFESGGAPMLLKSLIADLSRETIDTLVGAIGVDLPISKLKLELITSTDAQNDEEKDIAKKDVWGNMPMPEGGLAIKAGIELGKDSVNEAGDPILDADGNPIYEKYAGADLIVYLNYGHPDDKFRKDIFEKIPWDTFLDMGCLAQTPDSGLEKLMVGAALQARLKLKLSEIMPDLSPLGQLLGGLSLQLKSDETDDAKGVYIDFGLDVKANLDLMALIGLINKADNADKKFFSTLEARVEVTRYISDEDKTGQPALLAYIKDGVIYLYSPGLAIGKYKMNLMDVLDGNFELFSKDTSASAAYVVEEDPAPKADILGLLLASLGIGVNTGAETEGNPYDDHLLDVVLAGGFLGGILEPMGLGFKPGAITNDGTTVCLDLDGLDLSKLWLSADVKLQQDIEADKTAGIDLGLNLGHIRLALGGLQREREDGSFEYEDFGADIRNDENYQDIMNGGNVFLGLQLEIATYLKDGRISLDNMLGALLADASAFIDAGIDVSETVDGSIYVTVMADVDLCSAPECNDTKLLVEIRKRLTKEDGTAGDKLLVGIYYDAKEDILYLDCDGETFRPVALRNVGLIKLLKDKIKIGGSGSSSATAAAMPSMSGLNPAIIIGNKGLQIELLGGIARILTELIAGDFADYVDIENSWRYHECGSVLDPAIRAAAEKDEDGNVVLYQKDVVRYVLDGAGFRKSQPEDTGDQYAHFPNGVYEKIREPNPTLGTGILIPEERLKYAVGKTVRIKDAKGNVIEEYTTYREYTRNGGEFVEVTDQNKEEYHDSAKYVKFYYKNIKNLLSEEVTAEGYGISGWVKKYSDGGLPAYVRIPATEEDINLAKVYTGGSYTRVDGSEVSLNIPELGAKIQIGSIDPGYLHGGQHDIGINGLGIGLVFSPVATDENPDPAPCAGLAIKVGNIRLDKDREKNPILVGENRLTFDQYFEYLKGRTEEAGPADRRFPVVDVKDITGLTVYLNLDARIEIGFKTTDPAKDDHSATDNWKLGSMLGGVLGGTPSEGAEGALMEYVKKLLLKFNMEAPVDTALSLHVAGNVNIGALLGTGDQNANIVKMLENSDLAVELDLGRERLRIYLEKDASGVSWLYLDADCTLISDTRFRLPFSVIADIATKASASSASAEADAAVAASQDVAGILRMIDDLIGPGGVRIDRDRLYVNMGAGFLTTILSLAAKIEGIDLPLAEEKSFLEINVGPVYEESEAGEYVAKGEVYEKATGTEPKGTALFVKKVSYVEAPADVSAGTQLYVKTETGEYVEAAGDEPEGTGMFMKRDYSPADGTEPLSELYVRDNIYEKATGSEPEGTTKYKKTVGYFLTVGAGIDPLWLKVSLGKLQIGLTRNEEVFGVKRDAEGNLVPVRFYEDAYDKTSNPGGFKTFKDVAEDLSIAAEIGVDIELNEGPLSIGEIITAILKGTGTNIDIPVALDVQEDMKLHLRVQIAGNLNLNDVNKSQLKLAILDEAREGTDRDTFLGLYFDYDYDNDMPVLYVENHFAFKDGLYKVEDFDIFNTAFGEAARSLVERLDGTGVKEEAGASAAADGGEGAEILLDLSREAIRLEVCKELFTGLLNSIIPEDSPEIRQMFTDLGLEAVLNVDLPTYDEDGNPAPGSKPGLTLDVASSSLELAVLVKQLEISLTKMDDIFEGINFADFAASDPTSEKEALGVELGLTIDYDLGDGKYALDGILSDLAGAGFSMDETGNPTTVGNLLKILTADAIVETVRGHIGVKVRLNVLSAGLKEYMPAAGKHLADLMTGIIGGKSSGEAFDALKLLNMVEAAIILDLNGRTIWTSLVQENDEGYLYFTLSEVGGKNFKIPLETVVKGIRKHNPGPAAATADEDAPADNTLINVILNLAFASLSIADDDGIDVSLGNMFVKYLMSTLVANLIGESFSFSDGVEKLFELRDPYVKATGLGAAVPMDGRFYERQNVLRNVLLADYLPGNAVFENPFGQPVVEDVWFDPDGNGPGEMVQTIRNDGALYYKKDDGTYAKLIEPDGKYYDDKHNLIADPAKFGGKKFVQPEDGVFAPAADDAGEFPAFYVEETEEGKNAYGVRVNADGVLEYGDGNLGPAYTKAGDGYAETDGIHCLFYDNGTAIVPVPEGSPLYLRLAHDRYTSAPLFYKEDGEIKRFADAADVYAAAEAGTDVYIFREGRGEYVEAPADVPEGTPLYVANHVYEAYTGTVAEEGKTPDGEQLYVANHIYKPYDGPVADGGKTPAGGQLYVANHKYAAYTGTVAAEGKTPDGEQLYVKEYGYEPADPATAYPEDTVFYVEEDGVYREATAEDADAPKFVKKPTGAYIAATGDEPEGTETFEYVPDGTYSAADGTEADGTAMFEYVPDGTYSEASGDEPDGTETFLYVPDGTYSEAAGTEDELFIRSDYAVVTLDELYRKMEHSGVFLTKKGVFVNLMFKSDGAGRRGFSLKLGVSPVLVFSGDAFPVLPEGADRNDYEEDEGKGNITVSLTVDIEAEGGKSESETDLVGMLKKIIAVKGGKPAPISDEEFQALENIGGLVLGVSDSRLAKASLRISASANVGSLIALVSAKPLNKAELLRTLELAIELLDDDDYTKVLGGIYLYKGNLFIDYENPAKNTFAMNLSDLLDTLSPAQSAASADARTDAEAALLQLWLGDFISYRGAISSGLSLKLTTDLVDKLLSALLGLEEGTITDTFKNLSADVEISLASPDLSMRDGKIFYRFGDDDYVPVGTCFREYLEGDGIRYARLSEDGSYVRPADEKFYAEKHEDTYSEATGEEPEGTQLFVFADSAYREEIKADPAELQRYVKTTVDTYSEATGEESEGTQLFVKNEDGTYRPETDEDPADLQRYVKTTVDEYVEATGSEAEGTQLFVKNEDGTYREEIKGDPADMQRYVATDTVSYVDATSVPGAEEVYVLLDDGSYAKCDGKWYGAHEEYSAGPFRVYEDGDGIRYARLVRRGYVKAAGDEPEGTQLYVREDDGYRPATDEDPADMQRYVKTVVDESYVKPAEDKFYVKNADGEFVNPPESLPEGTPLYVKLTNGHCAECDGKWYGAADGCEEAYPERVVEYVRNPVPGEAPEYVRRELHFNQDAFGITVGLRVADLAFGLTIGRISVESRRIVPDEIAKMPVPEEAVVEIGLDVEIGILLLDTPDHRRYVECDPSYEGAKYVNVGTPESPEYAPYDSETHGGQQTYKLQCVFDLGSFLDNLGIIQGISLSNLLNIEVPDGGAGIRLTVELAAALNLSEIDHSAAEVRIMGQLVGYKDDMTERYGATQLAAAYLKNSELLLDLDGFGFGKARISGFALSDMLGGKHKIMDLLAPASAEGVSSAVAAQAVPRSNAGLIFNPKGLAVEVGKKAVEWVLRLGALNLNSLTYSECGADFVEKYAKLADGSYVHPAVGKFFVPAPDFYIRTPTYVPATGDEPEGTQLFVKNEDGTYTPAPDPLPDPAPELFVEGEPEYVKATGFEPPEDELLVKEVSYVKAVGDEPEGTQLYVKTETGYDEATGDEPEEMQLYVREVTYSPAPERIIDEDRVLVEASGSVPGGTQAYMQDREDEKYKECDGKWYRLDIAYKACDATYEGTKCAVAGPAGDYEPYEEKNKEHRGKTFYVKVGERYLECGEDAPDKYVYKGATETKALIPYEDSFSGKGVEMFRIMTTADIVSEVGLDALVEIVTDEEFAINVKAEAADLLGINVSVKHVRIGNTGTGQEGDPSTVAERLSEVHEADYPEVLRLRYEEDEQNEGKLVQRMDVMLETLALSVQLDLNAVFQNGMYIGPTPEGADYPLALVGSRVNKEPTWNKKGVTLLVNLEIHLAGLIDLIENGLDTNDVFDAASKALPLINAQISMISAADREILGLYVMGGNIYAVLEGLGFPNVMMTNEFLLEIIKASTATSSCSADASAISGNPKGASTILQKLLGGITLGEKALKVALANDYFSSLLDILLFDGNPYYEKVLPSETDRPELGFSGVRINLGELVYHRSEDPENPDPEDPEKDILKQNRKGLLQVDLEIMGTHLNVDLMMPVICVNRSIIDDNYFGHNYHNSDRVFKSADEVNGATLALGLQIKINKNDGVALGNILKGVVGDLGTALRVDDDIDLRLTVKASLGFSYDLATLSFALDDIGAEIRIGRYFADIDKVVPCAVITYNSEDKALYLDISHFMGEQDKDGNRNLGKLKVTGVDLKSLLEGLMAGGATSSSAEAAGRSPADFRKNPWYMDEDGNPVKIYVPADDRNYRLPTVYKKVDQEGYSLYRPLSGEKYWVRQGSKYVAYNSGMDGAATAECFALTADGYTPLYVINEAGAYEAYMRGSEKHKGLDTYTYGPLYDYVSYRLNDSTPLFVKIAPDTYRAHAGTDDNNKICFIRTAGNLFHTGEGEYKQLYVTEGGRYVGYRVGDTENKYKAKFLRRQKSSFAVSVDGKFYVKNSEGTFVEKTDETTDVYIKTAEQRYVEATGSEPEGTPLFVNTGTPDAPVYVAYDETVHSADMQKYVRMDEKYEKCTGGREDKEYIRAYDPGKVSYFHLLNNMQFVPYVPNPSDDDPSTKVYYGRVEVAEEDIRVKMVDGSIVEYNSNDKIVQPGNPFCMEDGTELYRYDFSTGDYELYKVSTDEKTRPNQLFVRFKEAGSSDTDDKKKYIVSDADSAEIFKKYADYRSYIDKPVLYEYVYGDELEAYRYVESADQTTPVDADGNYKYVLADIYGLSIVWADVTVKDRLVVNITGKAMMGLIAQFLEGQTEDNRALIGDLLDNLFVRLDFNTNPGGGSPFKLELGVDLLDPYNHNASAFGLTLGLYGFGSDKESPSMLSFDYEKLEPDNARDFRALADLDLAGLLAAADPEGSLLHFLSFGEKGTVTDGKLFLNASVGLDMKIKPTTEGSWGNHMSGFFGLTQEETNIYYDVPETPESGVGGGLKLDISVAADAEKLIGGLISGGNIDLEGTEARIVITLLPDILTPDLESGGKMIITVIGKDYDGLTGIYLDFSGIRKDEAGNGLGGMHRMSIDLAGLIGGAASRASAEAETGIIGKAKDGQKIWDALDAILGEVRFHDGKITVGLTHTFIGGLMKVLAGMNVASNAASVISGEVTVDVRNLGVSAMLWFGEKDESKLDILLDVGNINLSPTEEYVANGGTFVKESDRRPDADGNTKYGDVNDMKLDLDLEASLFYKGEKPEESDPLELSPLLDLVGALALGKPLFDNPSMKVVLGQNIDADYTLGVHAHLDFADFDNLRITAEIHRKTAASGDAGGRLGPLSIGAYMDAHDLYIDLGGMTLPRIKLSGINLGEILEDAIGGILESIGARKPGADAAACHYSDGIDDFVDYWGNLLNEEGWQKSVPFGCVTAGMNHIGVSLNAMMLNALLGALSPIIGQSVQLPDFGTMAVMLDGGHRPEDETGNPDPVERLKTEIVFQINDNFYVGLRIGRLTLNTEKSEGYSSRAVKVFDSIDTAEFTEVYDIKNNEIKLERVNAGLDLEIDAGGSDTSVTSGTTGSFENYLDALLRQLLPDGKSLPINFRTLKSGIGYKIVLRASLNVKSLMDALNGQAAEMDRWWKDIELFLTLEPKGYAGKYLIKLFKMRGDADVFADLSGLSLFKVRLMGLGGLIGGAVSASATASEEGAKAAAGGAASILRLVLYQEGMQLEVGMGAVNGILALLGSGVVIGNQGCYVDEKTLYVDKSGTLVKYDPENAEHAGLHFYQNTDQPMYLDPDKSVKYRSRKDPTTEPSQEYLPKYNSEGGLIGNTTGFATITFQKGTASSTIPLPVLSNSTALVLRLNYATHLDLSLGVGLDDYGDSLNLSIKNLHLSLDDEGEDNGYVRFGAKDGKLNGGKGDGVFNEVKGENANKFSGIILNDVLGINLGNILGGVIGGIDPNITIEWNKRVNYGWKNTTDYQAAQGNFGRTNPNKSTISLFRTNGDTTNSKGQKVGSGKLEAFISVNGNDINAGKPDGINVLHNRKIRVWLSNSRVYVDLAEIATILGQLEGIIGSLANMQIAYMDVAKLDIMDLLGGLVKGKASAVSEATAAAEGDEEEDAGFDILSLFKSVDVDWWYPTKNSSSIRINLDAAAFNDVLCGLYYMIYGLCYPNASPTQEEFKKLDTDIRYHIVTGKLGSTYKGYACVNAYRLSVMYLQHKLAVMLGDMTHQDLLRQALDLGCPGWMNTLLNQLTMTLPDILGSLLPLPLLKETDADNNPVPNYIEILLDKNQIGTAGGVIKQIGLYMNKKKGGALATDTAEIVINLTESLDLRAVRKVTNFSSGGNIPEAGPTIYVADPFNPVEITAEALKNRSGLIHTVTSDYYGISGYNSKQSNTPYDVGDGKLGGTSVLWDTSAVKLEPGAESYIWACALNYRFQKIKVKVSSNTDFSRLYGYVNPAGKFVQTDRIVIDPTRNPVAVGSKTLTALPNTIVIMRRDGELQMLDVDGPDPNGKKQYVVDGANMQPIGKFAWFTPSADDVERGGIVRVNFWYQAQHSSRINRAITVVYNNSKIDEVLLNASDQYDILIRPDATADDFTPKNLDILGNLGLADVPASTVNRAPEGAEYDAAAEYRDGSRITFTKSPEDTDEIHAAGVHGTFERSFGGKILQTGDYRYAEGTPPEASGGLFAGDSDQAADGDYGRYVLENVVNPEGTPAGIGIIRVRLANGRASAVGVAGWNYDDFSYSMKSPEKGAVGTIGVLLDKYSGDPEGTNVTQTVPLKINVRMYKLDMLAEGNLPVNQYKDLFVEAADGKYVLETVETENGPVQGYVLAEETGPEETGAEETGAEETGAEETEPPKRYNTNFFRHGETGVMVKSHKFKAERVPFGEDEFVFFTDVVTGTDGKTREMFVVPSMNASSVGKFKVTAAFRNTGGAYTQTFDFKMLFTEKKAVKAVVYVDKDTVVDAITSATVYFKDGTSTDGIPIKNIVQNDVNGITEGKVWADRTGTIFTKALIGRITGKDEAGADIWDAGFTQNNVPLEIRVH